MVLAPADKRVLNIIAPMYVAVCLSSTDPIRVPDAKGSVPYVDHPDQDHAHSVMRRRLAFGQRDIRPHYESHRAVFDAICTVHTALEREDRLNFIHGVESLAHSLGTLVHTLGEHRQYHSRFREGPFLHPPSCAPGQHSWEFSLLYDEPLSFNPRGTLEGAYEGIEELQSALRDARNLTQPVDTADLVDLGRRNELHDNLTLVRRLIAHAGYVLPV